MEENPVKKKIQQGGVSIGTMLFEFHTTGIARIVAQAGAEFIVYDMEHNGWSLDTLKMLFATTYGTTLVPMVRVPTTDYHFIAHALDVGARGIMVPMVESESQARAIIASAKYPPVGRRGASFGSAHDHYTSGDIVEKIASSNRETLILAQIETAQGVENADAIAALEGIDVLWIGHFDLSISLGIPGQFDHPRFKEAVQRVLMACKNHRKTAGHMATDVAMGNQLLSQGFRILAYGGDIGLYQSALRSGITALKAAEGR